MSSDVKRYEGKEATVTWDKRLCIHGGECGRAESVLFAAKRQPWCDPDLATLEEVEDVCQRCPTGALAYTRSDGKGEVAPAVNRVVVANNGPLYVTGELDVEGAAADMPGVRFRAALCRCGQSKNKPFCDNSHESAGFVDRGAVGQSRTMDGPASGPLAIKLAPKGPLLLRGPVQIVAATGRVAWEGEKAALCRCGASKNKPFCDGSHTGVGFEG
jgi:CDGSH-type Zn-finger protein/uncharacterized Fe-S cluster protein YjdI